MKTLPLSRSLSARVDDDTYQTYSHWRWFALPTKRGYRVQGYDPRQPEKRRYLSRLVLESPPGEVICVDGDTLNLQRSNLEVRAYQVV